MVGLAKLVTGLLPPNMETAEDPKVPLLGFAESILLGSLFNVVKVLKPDGIVVVATFADVDVVFGPKVFVEPKALELVEVPNAPELVGVPKAFELVEVPKAFEVVEVPKPLLEVTAMPKELIAAVGILEVFELVVVVAI